MDEIIATALVTAICGLIKAVAGRLIAFLLGLTSASVLRGAFSRLNKREYI